MARKIIAILLALTLMFAMSAAALALTGNAGLGITGTEYQPTPYNPVTQPPPGTPGVDFPTGAATTGLDFGTIVMSSNAYEKFSADDSRTLDGERSGVRVHTSYNFELRMTLGTFSAAASGGPVPTLQNARIHLTNDAASLTVATGPYPGFLTGTGWSCNYNLVATNAPTHTVAAAAVAGDGIPHPIVRTTGIASGTETNWMTNFTGQLNIIQGTIASAGETTAVMTWTTVTN